MSENTKNEKMEAIVSLAKRRGFIYQGSDIYGGLSGTWDFGPLGVALKRNIMNLWWKMFVLDREDMYGVDAAILMNQKVWKASGHVDTFSDPLTVCLECNSRQRVDNLLDIKAFSQYRDSIIGKLYIERLEDHKALSLSEETEFEKIKSAAKEAEKIEQPELKYKAYKILENNLLNSVNAGLLNVVYVESLLEVLNNALESFDYLGKYTKIYLNSNIKCPVCGGGNWSMPNRFNMMFKTNVGPIEDENSVSYLRPETAQGIFTNYKNIVDCFYPDLPFGIAQQGKAFRNEISPRDFIFRSREFEQMEIEYFVNPNDWEAAFDMWRKLVWGWCAAIGLPTESVHEDEIPADKLAHYSKRTIDFMFDFPIGREELLGLAYRTDFDLGNIQREAGKSMDYVIKGTNEKLVPHVIEPSFGVERALMAVLSTAYTEDEVNGEKRIYLKLPEHLAPIKFAVSPLLKNKPELVAKAREVYSMLKKKHGAVMWDDNGNIGKRYRRQDEIGTPHCVVIDFDTLENDTVTIRDRDTTEQKRVAISEL